MNYLFRTSLFYLLIEISIISVAYACGDFPVSGFDDPDMRHFTGAYYNPNYGYSVIIPKGLTGHDAAPPAPHHGFGIVLSWEPRAYVYVDGSYNSSELESIEDVETQHLTWLKEESGKIDSVDHIVTNLGSLEARRFIALHTCPQVGGNFIDDYIFAFSKNKDIIYTVALLTTEARYKKDKRVLEQLIKTWELKPIK